jgi:hypothetical protein
MGTWLDRKECVQMYSDCIKDKYVKFKPYDGSGMTIQLFANEANLKLVNHGRDLLFYISDDDGKMVNIVTDYTKFALHCVQE